ncbi:hypothetical protein BWGOE8_52080 [Bacillus mycoides]|uniref:Uncharacterized protein n=1 Tax=Bacillus mycoides TaxID=1405 RepID=A0A1E8B0E5_BACMY|nr:hypothetical protein BWGOE9_53120 [Bacillus mycoides]OFD71936.1 hypothetical protein BWGOE8_52080 [Bacillus mycoides]OFD74888.1 hypothetical protein BWGOE10_52690 [Bacillus mycoides]
MINDPCLCKVFFMFLKAPAPVPVMTKRGPLTQDCMCYFQVYVKMKV